MSEKKLSDAAVAISKDLRKALTFDEKNVANLGNEVYVEHAKHVGLEESTIVKVKEYDRTFGAGLMDATAHVALSAIKKAESLADAKFEVNAKGLAGEAEGQDGGEQAAGEAGRGGLGAHGFFLGSSGWDESRDIARHHEPRKMTKLIGNREKAAQAGVSSQRPGGLPL